MFWIAPWAELRPMMVEAEPAPVAMFGLPLAEPALE